MFGYEINNSDSSTFHFYIISFLIALCSMFIKMPQIRNILHAKKAKSVSLRAILTETCGHSIVLVYHFAMNYPFTSYSEYIFLVPQDLILLCILLYYNDRFDMRVVTGFMVYFFSCIFLASGVISNAVLKIAIILATPISFFSKSLQIYSLHQSKDVGQLSFTTWLATTVCSTARLLTSLYETGDHVVSMNFLCSILLNIVIMVQIVYYNWVNRKEKLP
ncbi:mannose-P-dolichol utilization defect 1 protein homolog isoform X1 [Octopus bimaculoides]|uniref:Solute carrier family 66 member 3 n=1 Tax=Octopus bimaculoides TaxID=37653 RepID=A0A0L8HP60_OCTBM|nr:mannose-P-dolichol utilization defect 1 protein homolog isoform X1 [Octopus bimaculoides]|eukprot:XP_014770666.1 PREDICTED: mannose-P-dolichol utilization defect 1 protein homolog isoform X1 [Octopus bimaculoides]